MSKNKTFQLIYQIEAESLDEVCGLVFEVHQNTGMEPVSLTLPSGKELPWNGYLAHQFAGKGRITEDEFIKMSLSADAESKS